MSFDHQMLRFDDGSFNLNLGEPNFLQECLPDIHQFQHTGMLRYPNPKGNEELITQLSELYPNNHIIICNGAKQAISAGLFALMFCKNHYSVYAKAPYWPSYPTLAKFVNMTFMPGVYAGGTSIISASPNNPDGEEDLSYCDIWDRVYASPLYGWSGKEPEHLISVGSAAKSYGLSGLRVGWLVTKNDKLAKEAMNYMEMTTTGVSIEAQLHLSYVIKCHRAGALDLGFKKAREFLLNNGEIFNYYLEKFCDDVKGVPYSDRGMFSWFKIAKVDIQRFEKALLDSNVRVVTGEACGSMTKGWFRMSMGQTNGITEEALSGLKKCMDNG